MFRSKENLDFTEISNQIYANYAEHEKTIKQFCVKSSIISLTDFYNGYQREVKEINSEITPSKDRPTNSDFSDIFKAFEEYPANMQKLKKSPKELQRMNSTILKGPSVDGNLPKDASSSSINISKLEDCPTAVETYNEFKKFHNKLQQVLHELQQKDLTAEYAVKLQQQLQLFARQMEKLVPADRIGLQAFSADEEAALLRMLANMEELNFIQANQDVFQRTLGTTIAARMDNLVEVLTHTLMSISCYNII